MAAMDENKFKVTLKTTEPAGLGAGGGRRRVAFDVSPDVIETRNVNYKTLEPVHMPGGIYVYGNSASRIFQISNARLVARTLVEATKNMEILHTLRGWTMPFFGISPTESTTETGQSRGKADIGQAANALGARTVDQVSDAAKAAIGSFRAAQDASLPPVGPINQGAQTQAEVQASGFRGLGAPPNVLLLSAYSPPLGPTASKPFPTNISNIPVVITSLSIPYPGDVDYIPDVNGQPIPRVMTIDIQLVETHSPTEYQRFDLRAYREGRLTGF